MNGDGSAGAPAAVEGPAYTIHRNWYFPAFCAVLLIVGSLCVELATFERAALGALAAFWGGTFGAIVLVRNGFRLHRSTSVRATADALTIGDARSIAAEDILETKLLSRGGRRGEDAEVELVLRDRARVVLGMDRSTAVEVLRILHIGAGERRTSFRLVVPYAKRFVATYALLASAFLVLALPSALLGGSALFAFLQILFGLSEVAVVSALVAWPLGRLPKHVVIGGDGFAVRWLGRERYHRFADVEDVRAKTPDTLVKIRSGKRMALRPMQIPQDDGTRGAEARALHEHLATAWMRAVRNASASAAAPLLRREGRTPASWLASLEQLASGGAAYRVASLTPDVLSDVLQATGTDGEVRIGAAAALLRKSPAEHRALVRVAAEACAEPTTRAALLELAEAVTTEEMTAALASEPQPANARVFGGRRGT